jgi:glycosyltransferase involved in cell wall biosynthesis
MRIPAILLSLFILYLFGNTIARSGSDSDFLDYYGAASRFSKSQDIYAFEEIQSAQGKIKTPEELFLPENAQLLDLLLHQAGGYIYPPSFAFLLIPFTNFSESTAALIFGLLNLICLLSSLVLIGQWMSEKINRENLVLWSCFLGLIFSFRFLENHTNNNQVAFLLMFLVLASIRWKNPIGSGILLSLAIVIKLTPAVFLFYFFWKREYTKLLATFLFLGVWIFLPGIYDWDLNLKYLQNWNELVLQSAMKTPLFRAWKNNQSLIATLAKYFMDFADPINQPMYRMPWVQLSQSTVYAIFYSFIGILGIPLVWKSYFSKLKLSDEQMVSLLFIIAVIFSGIAWIHSFSFLLFPFIFLASEFLSKNFSKNQKNVYLIASISLIFINRGLIGNFIESFFLMSSIYLYYGFFFYFFILSIRSSSNKENIKKHSPIRVAVDARPLAFGITGNSRYLAEVLEVLGRQPDKFEFFLYSHRGIHPVFSDLSSLPGIRIRESKSKIPGPIWLHSLFPYFAWRDKADLIWGTLQLLPFFRFSIPYMVNYHDLNVESAPDTMEKWNYYQHKLLSRNTLKIATRILCLSKNTIQDIHNFFPEVSQKCTLIYPGVRPSNSESGSPPQAWVEKSLVGKPFLFTLGTLEPRKNWKTIIDAYRQIRSGHPNYSFPLVLAGRKGWGEDCEFLYKSLSSGEWEKEQIYFFENPGEEELRWLYKNCAYFLFPSLHEGFGLPLLEAMKENKHCIASDIPVFKEILESKGDILVPPRSVQDWVRAFLQAEKLELVSRDWDGTAWSWANTAEKIKEEMNLCLKLE